MFMIKFYYGYKQCMFFFEKNIKRESLIIIRLNKYE
jgi:hypothetical protein